MTSDCRLDIDTTERGVTRVRIESGEVHVAKEVAQAGYTSQAVLPMLEEVLAKAGRTLSDISAIHVATGPGSFTGLRVGVAIANALGMLLKVSVNNEPVGTYSLPTYTASKFDPSTH